MGGNNRFINKAYLKRHEKCGIITCECFEYACSTTPLFHVILSTTFVVRPRNTN